MVVYLSPSYFTGQADGVEGLGSIVNGRSACTMYDKRGKVERKQLFG